MAIPRRRTRNEFIRPEDANPSTDNLKGCIGESKKSENVRDDGQGRGYKDDDNDRHDEGMSVVRRVDDDQNKTRK